MKRFLVILIVATSLYSQEIHTNLENPIKHITAFDMVIITSSGIVFGSLMGGAWGTKVSRDDPFAGAFK